MLGLTLVDAGKVKKSVAVVRGFDGYIDAIYCNAFCFCLDV